MIRRHIMKITERHTETPMSRPMRPLWTSWTVAALSLAVARVDGRAAELHVGGATVSITPDRPVALAGQMHTRIARALGAR